MQPSFWSNTIWYVLLGLSSIISIVLTFYKSNNRKFLIGFSFSVLGTTFFAETVLLTITNGYRYLPRLMNDAFLDSIAGNYFSQLALTSTSILIVIYKLPTIWSFIFAGAYFLIEELFLELGIYQHFWYRTWYTPIAVLLMFWTVKKWYRYMQSSPKSFICYITLFLGASSLFSITVAFYFFAFAIEVINFKFIFNEFFRNQAIFAVSFRSIWIIIMIVLHRLNLKLICKGSAFVFLFIAQYILINLKFITIKDGWFWAVTLLNIAGSYLAVVLIDYLLKHAGKSTSHFINWMYLCCKKDFTWQMQ